MRYVLAPWATPKETPGATTGGDTAEPPSAAVVAASLGRGEAAGLLAAHDAYGSDLIGYAEFLLVSRPGDAAVHLADEAADAVLDALLASTGAVADLADPARLRAWLLALTRNECLRRRPGTGAPSSSEAAELGRRGLGPKDVAALLGFAPAALPARVPAVETVPAWLRAELAAAAGAEGASRRAELARRGRPFEPDGFPVPLDRRRLSGKALAWSAAAVVVLAGALLIALPTPGDAGAAPGAGPVLAAAASDAVAPPAPAPDAPLPTLAETPFGSAARTRAAAPPAPTTVAAPPGPATPAAATRPPARPGAQTADRPGRAGGLALSWTPAAAVTCGGDWAARLHVTTGGVAVSRVVAVAGRGGPVELQPDGDGWSGTLSGLPTDRGISVTVFAGGQVRPTGGRLDAGC